MKVVAVIPARYGATRLPGKPLIDIEGKPMIWWVYERVKSIAEIDEVYVATDDIRIQNICNKYAIPTIMTSTKHRTAANRLQEVSEIIKADYYLQLNGDEPLIDQNVVKSAIPKSSIPQDVEYGINIITNIQSTAQLMDTSNIKVVFDDNMKALYMSRTPIPFPYGNIDFEYYKHVGIIGYNKKMLDFYNYSKPGKFEVIEGIDTLRFIDYGKTLQFVFCEDCHTLSVDTQKDLDIVRKLIKDGKNEKI